MQYILSRTLGLITLLGPGVALAAAPATFSQLVGLLIAIIGLIIPFLIAVIFLVIIWKLIDAWILHPEDPTKIQEGKAVAIAGVVGITIIMILWGLVELLRDSLL